MIKKVGVVCGGYSSEHKISLQSAETVFSNLDRNKWEAFLIIIEKSKWRERRYWKYLRSLKG